MVIDRKERNKILNQLKPIENTYKNHLRFRGKTHASFEQIVKLCVWVTESIRSKGRQNFN